MICHAPCPELVLFLSQYVVHYVGPCVGETVLPHLWTFLVFFVESLDIAGDLSGRLPRIEIRRRFITVLRRHHR